MTKKKIDIPSDKVSCAEAARILTAAGDKTSGTNLRKYAKKHGLTHGKIGRALMVDPAELYKYRAENYTTEVMRGDHSKTKPPKKSPAKSAAAKKPAEKSTPTKSDNVASLDAARLAKAAGERIKTESLELDLQTKKQNLIDAAAAESAAALSMAAIKSHLLNDMVSNVSEALLAALNLPDAKKRTIEPVLEKEIRTSLTKGRTVILDEFTAFNTRHAHDMPTRFDALTSEAARLRDLSITKFKKEARTLA